MRPHDTRIDQSRFLASDTSSRLVTAAGVLGVCVALIIGPAVHAAETVIPVTPPGATDVDQAFLPPVPGFYGAASIIPYAQNYHVYDSSGARAPAFVDLHERLQLYVAALLYVYPFTVAGGTVASSFVQPLQNLHYSIGTTQLSGSAVGLSDAYSDLFYWTKNVGLAGATTSPMPLSYGLSVGGGLAMIVPDGKWRPDKPLNPSAHFWVVDPNMSLTYNTGPHLSLGDNTQFSTRAFYGIPLENPKTRYTSGNVIDIDYSITEQFGAFRIGVAGVYQTQLTNDRLRNGQTPPDGGKFGSGSVGPIAEYFIPSLGMLLKAKYLYTYYHKNFVDEQLVVLTTALKF